MPRWMDRFLRRPVELSVVEAYRRWAPSYPPHAHNRLMELEERDVLQMLPDVRGRTALDLACGSGRYIRLLLERGAYPVVGIDISPPMLTRARNISSNLVLADLLSLSVRSHQFQVMTCGLAVGHVEDLRQAMIEISRALAFGGTVVYSDFHPSGSCLGWKRTFRGDDGIEYDARHYTHLYSDHVSACKEAGLHIEEVREPRIDFENKWLGHPALLIIRARKENSPESRFLADS